MSVSLDNNDNLWPFSPGENSGNDTIDGGAGNDSLLGGR